MYVQLPFKKGIISCYPNYGAYFSIINAYNKEYLVWVYNYFIQLLVPYDYSRGMRMDFAPPHIQGFPWIITNIMDRFFVKRKWENFVNFARECLNEGFYIYSLMDVSFIGLYNKREHKQHEILLLGYDDEKEQFIFADNYDKGKYEIGKATFSEIEKANDGMEEFYLVDWLSGYHLLKVRDVFDFGMYNIGTSYQYKFNVNLYIELLKDFLDGKESYSRWSVAPIFFREDLIEKDNAWGIRIYEVLRKYVIFCEANKKEFDGRSFEVLKEHKKILRKTVLYLIETGYIDNNKELQVYLDESCKISSILLILVIKISIKYDVALKNSILTYINILEKNDLFIITRLLELLMVSAKY